MADFADEAAEILATQDHAENQKTKELKRYQTTYKINIRSISCKRLLNSSINNAIHPYIVFQVQGSTQNAVTSVHEKTRNPVFSEEKCLDGFCVGSDLLKVLVYDCENETEPDLAKDKCIGYAQINICDLELGEILKPTIKLFKARSGKPLKDKRSREGSAGTLTCEMHIADMGSIAWEPRTWGATYYRAWVHFVSAENVPLVDGNLPNPYLLTKIKPASNIQEQKTSTCLQITNPVWNELHCYMVDDYQHQLVTLKLQTDVDGKTVVLAKTSFQLGLAKPNEITTHNLSMNSGVSKPDEKGCILRLRCQLLEKNKIPFDGSVAFKHDLFNCEVTAIEGKEIAANAGDRPICVVSIDKNHKTTKESDQAATPQWDQTVLFRRVQQRQYLDVKVQDAHHRLGNVRIHLTRIPLNQETDNWYTLLDTSTGQVHLRIRLTRCEDNEIYDDDPEHHCHFDWDLDINSDYSTDFTGYSNFSGKSLSLTISDSAEKFHYEPRHAVDLYDEKPVRLQVVSGSLSAGKEIYRLPSASQLYAKVALWNKGHEKHFTSTSNGTEDFESPTFNTDFDFPRVKKGDTVRITIYEKIESGDTPVGWAIVQCKALQEEQTLDLKLEIPKRILKASELKRYEGVGELGSVQLSLKSKVTFQ